MNRLMLSAAVIAALSLSACQREVHRVQPLKTVSQLTCPVVQGQLKRVSASADGQTCAYQGDDTEVTLRLLALKDADARTALAPIETELKGLMPVSAPEPLGSPQVPAVAAEPEEPASGKAGNVTIDFPGLQVHANDSGAQVRVAGMHVDADDDGARVRLGGDTLVNASDKGAEIRQVEDNDEGLHSTFILAGDDMSSGFRVVGYEARGPKAGPLVVAVVKSRAEHNDRKAFDDMKALVKLNVGG
jgi:hypothetical protein